MDLFFFFSFCFSVLLCSVCLSLTQTFSFFSLSLSLYVITVSLSLSFFLSLCHFSLSLYFTTLSLSVCHLSLFFSFSISFSFSPTPSSFPSSPSYDLYQTIFLVNSLEFSFWILSEIIQKLVKEKLIIVIRLFFSFYSTIFFLFNFNFIFIFSCHNIVISIICVHWGGMRYIFFNYGQYIVDKT